MEKRKYFFIIIIIIVIGAGIAMQFDTRHHVNSLWNSSMKSSQGEFSIRTEWYSGGEKSVSISDTIYETRENGFYYKQMEYDIREDGERILKATLEVSENGRKVKVNNLPEVTDDARKITSAEDLLTGIWEPLTNYNVKSIEKETEEVYTKYVIDFSIEGKSKYSNVSDSEILERISQKKIILLVDERQKKIKNLRWCIEGAENDSDETPMSATIDVEFQ